MKLAWSELLELASDLLAPWGEKFAVKIVASFSFAEFETKLASGPHAAALILMVDDAGTDEGNGSPPSDGGVTSLIRCGLRVQKGFAGGDGKTTADKKLLKLIDDLTLYLRSLQIWREGDPRDVLQFRFRGMNPVDLGKEGSAAYEATFAVWHELPNPAPQGFSIK